MSVIYRQNTESLKNNLLSGLPGEAFALLEPNLTTFSMKQGDVLYETGDEVEYVYFPHNGMLSLLVVMNGGKAIETATVGREGVVGAMAGLGLYTSMIRVVVQLPLDVSRIAAGRFRHAVSGGKAIADMCIRYNEVLLSQARITAACNALHSVDERICRWLLQSADRAESASVALTQELLSEMLGVRRTSVTEAAGKLQQSGVISFARGRIQIVDREALETLSCECYKSLLDQSATLGRHRGYVR
jgi:CRP-like cAMP-binding protein